jgi:hypothetical protein
MLAREKRLFGDILRSCQLLCEVTMSSLHLALASDRNLLRLIFTSSPATAVWWIQASV